MFSAKAELLIVNVKPIAFRCTRARLTMMGHLDYLYLRTGMDRQGCTD